MAVSGSGASGKFHGLRRFVSPEEQDQKLRDVASKYEQQFLKEMVKAMRGTVQESGLVKTNMGEKIFRDELDQEYINNWSKQGGVGFADIIYNQLIDKYGAQLGIKPPVQKPVGPINFNEKSQFIPRSSMNSSAPTQKMNFTFQRDLQLTTEALKAPWDGNYLGAQKINDSEYMIGIEHFNGLRSQIVFRGQMQPGLKQGLVQAGETIGLLSPEAKQFSWNVEKNSDSQKGEQTLEEL